MKKAEVYQKKVLAGFLEEIDRDHYQFIYHPEYRGDPVSLTMPVRAEPYQFDKFPPLFEGLLPEGVQLEALLRTYKVDKGDLFQQLMIVGEDVVGSLTMREVK